MIRDREFIITNTIHIITTDIINHIMVDIHITNPILTQDTEEHSITVQNEIITTQKTTILVPRNLQKRTTVQQKEIHQQQHEQQKVMDEHQRITPELIDQLNKMSEQLATPQTVVAECATYDEFVDWCETDIGLPLERRYRIFTDAEAKFRKAGYPDHAEIIKITHAKLKAQNN